MHYLTEDCATSTREFENITSRAPIHRAGTDRPFSMVSEDSSDESEGSEFGFGNDEDEMEDDGDEEDDEEEGDDDDEGDEMEKDKDDGGCRFEQIVGKRNTPTREVEIMDVDDDEPVSQEPPRVGDGTTHPSNASTRVLPSSPPAVSNPALTQHGTKNSSSLPPPLAQNPLPSPSTANTAPQDRLSSVNDVTSWPKRNIRARVLQDQGIVESGGGCAAEHCEEPERVDEMVSCAGVGCKDQASLICGLCMVQMLTSSAVSFDLCGNCAC